MNDNSKKDYDNQIKDYIENHLNLKNYKITYKEEGAIPLFYPTYEETKNKINIGTAGGMTRLSTGYTFLNIQEHSKYICENIENYLNLKNYKITYKEEGAIPLFYPTYEETKNKINIGTAGGMTRLSTGYTFLNIQEHSKYISKNVENISKAKKFEINKKYQFLDDIFLKVLEKHPEKMPDIFFKMFKASPKTVIKFLSNKSNFFEDLSIIFKMPKITFIKALFY